MSWEDEAKEISARRRQAKEMGGAAAVEKQHAAGKLSIRERVNTLLDANSFQEQGELAGHNLTDEKGNSRFVPANYVLGIGELDGRPCVVGGEDFTQKGGSPSPSGFRKSVYAETLAADLRLPLIRLLEGGGGSVSKGSKVQSGDPVFANHRFQSVATCLATAPVVSAALGPVAGLPAARLVASHFAVMTRNTAQVMVGGPALVERAMGKSLSKEELGGAAIHARSGVVDAVVDNENEAFACIKRFLSYLPLRVGERPPKLTCNDPPERKEAGLLDIVPRERRKVYDMRQLLRWVLDEDSFFEMTSGYGRTQITALARIAGETVGVWANDPRFYGGSLDAEGAEKIRRFIELCETFALPVVAFVDEPGFLIGPDAEKTGTIRVGTRALLSVVQSRVPWASIIVRKAYGVAAAAHFAPGAWIWSWPSAERGALPLEGGVAVAFRRELAEAEDPEALRQQLETQLAARRNPFAPAEHFSVHDLIDPRETRMRLCQWIGWIEGKRTHASPTIGFSYRP